MDDEKLNKPTSRKSSSVNGEGGKGKDINDKGDGGEVALKAKMSLMNGITVIVGSIIGKVFIFHRRMLDQSHILHNKTIKNTRYEYSNVVLSIKQVQVFL